MGKIDTITKDYMKDCEVFADAFNYFVFDGKQVIKPEKLFTLDTTEIAIPFGNGDEVAVQKFRDLLKASVLMMDDNAAYLILGVENESDVKYAEPVKNGLYDFLQYSKQVQQVASKHKKAKDQKGHTEGEFLSGFYKEDKLTPVITLVILFGSKEWDGPRTLHEMMSTHDPQILKYVADYKINLIEPAAMESDDFDKFHSNLRLVLSFIKYSNNWKKLTEFLASEEEKLETLNTEAARVIGACADLDFHIDEKAEVVNVCQAVREMNEMARLETLREAIKNVMDSLKVGVEEAMRILKVSKDDRATLMKMI